MGTLKRRVEGMLISSVITGTNPKAQMVFIWAIVTFYCSVILAESTTEVPPIPPGYPDESAVKTAILLGQIPLINLGSVSILDGVEEILDIEYGMGGESKLRLNLYLPKDRTRPTPAILFLHGGGWRSGTRSQMKYYCIKFAENGFITATTSYRLSTEVPFPAAVHDAKCAIRWLRANAAQYHIDPDRIVVSGHSAGGHLAMMIGYSDNPSLEGIGGNDTVSSRVCAVVSFYGPVDLTTDFATQQGVVRDFMGGKTIDEARDMYTLASPLFHLTRDDPPTLIFHGTIDSLVLIEQADRLAKRLTDLGIDHAYERYEGWPHTMDLAKAVNRRCVYQMTQFLGKYVSGNLMSESN